MPNSLLSRCKCFIVIFQVTRYKVVVASNSYLRGLQAIKKKGVDYCIGQLSLGVEHFVKITKADYGEINEIFGDFLWHGEQDNSDETADTFFHNTGDIDFPWLQDDDFTACDDDIQDPDSDT